MWGMGEEIVDFAHPMIRPYSMNCAANFELLPQPLPNFQPIITIAFTDPRNPPTMYFSGARSYMYIKCMILRTVLALYIHAI